MDQLENLSIQELRQALRERGANCRGSKKQLMTRLAEQYGFQSNTPSASVAKVRVSVQKSRNSACALLLDPSQSPEHNLHELLQKARTKFRFKPAHLYVIGTANQGGGTELTSENLRTFLQDGLVVLATVQRSAPPPVAAGDEVAPAQLQDVADDSGSGVRGSPELPAHQPSQPLHQPSEEHKEDSVHAKDLTDSGSCSSEQMDDGDAIEHMDRRSFDSDSLYSFSAAELAHHTAASSSPSRAHSSSSPGPTYSRPSYSNLTSHHPSNVPVIGGKGWRWMLPRAADQLPHPQPQSASSQKPPPHPTSPSLAPRPAATIAVAPALPVPIHLHRNHRCLPAASASSSPSPPPAAGAPLPSLMDELLYSSPSKSFARTTPQGACVCCEAGCELDFSGGAGSGAAGGGGGSASSRPMSPMELSSAPLLRTHSSPLSEYAQTPPPPSSSAAAASSSSLAASSTSVPPAHPPQLSSSFSSSSLDSFRALSDENRRLTATLADTEKRARRAESSLRAFAKSDAELRARLTALSSGEERVAGIEEQFAALQITLDLRDKEMSKVVWERDRLKVKNKTLMQKNNELKTDSEALQMLRKEHATLQQTHARLCGHNVNASTPPNVLQELLSLHASAIERVHTQMAANIAEDRRALREARACKVCLARPADTILLPCSHFVLCGACAASVNRCPICRSPAHDKRPVYM